MPGADPETIQKDDLLWCIAKNDESQGRSLQKSKFRPAAVKVVALDPIKVASVRRDGEPDLDTNATATFRTADPSEFLFRNEADAWDAYADWLREKADKMRKKAENLAQRAAKIHKGLIEARSPESLTLLDMDASFEHVQKVRQTGGSASRPMGAFPHHFHSDSQTDTDYE